MALQYNVDGPKYSLCTTNLWITLPHIAIHLRSDLLADWDYPELCPLTSTIEQEVTFHLRFEAFHLLNPCTCTGAFQELGLHQHVSTST